MDDEYYNILLSFNERIDLALALAHFMDKIVDRYEDSEFRILQLEKYNKLLRKILEDEPDIRRVF